MHRFLSRTRAAALALGVLALSSQQYATAGSIEQFYIPNWIPMPRLEWDPLPQWLPSVPPKGGTGGGQEYDPSPTATYEMSNIGGYSFPPCEPNPNGIMTKTQWGAAGFQRAGRVVIHTFGSDFNTAVAAYKGSSCGSLVPVTFNGNRVLNDNFAVQGISTTQSLVQFDAVANTPYRIQIGGRAGAGQTEGDIYATVSRLPPGGRSLGVPRKIWRRFI